MYLIMKKNHAMLESVNIKEVVNANQAVGNDATQSITQG